MIKKPISTLTLFVVLLALFVAACTPTTAGDSPTEQPNPTTKPIEEPTAPVVPIDPKNEGTLVFVDEIDILIMESFPVQVMAVVRGNLADGCVILDGLTPVANAGNFTIEIKAHREGDACTQALIPFEEGVSLDVLGLPAGDYLVTAGDKSATFNLAIDNQIPDGIESEEKSFFVSGELADCVGVAPQKCMLVKESPDGEYEYFYDHITGFFYEEGNEYEIRVRVTHNPYPPADGSTVQYELLEIVSQTAVEMSNDELSGTSWRIQDIAGNSGFETLPIEDDAFIRFEKGEMSGKASCNNFFGSYAADAGTLEILAPIGATLMSCGEEADGRDTLLFTLLEQAAGYVLDADMLTLTDQNGNVIVVLTPQESDENPLFGRKWGWQGYYDMSEENSFEVADPTQFSIEFFADGALTLQVDCNEGFGSYFAESGGIILHPAIENAAFCGEDSLDTVFMQNLRDVAGYVVENGELYLNLKADAGNMRFVPIDAQ